MLTLKRVREMFPDMENIEYHVGGIDKQLTIYERKDENEFRALDN